MRSISRENEKHKQREREAETEKGTEAEGGEERRNMRRKWNEDGPEKVEI